MNIRKFQKQVFHYSQLLTLVVFIISCAKTKKEEQTVLSPPVIAPFKNLDTICTNDWWNRQPNEIINVKINRKDVVAFGLYTVANKKLKLTAQLFPLYPKETRKVRLAVFKNDTWVEIQEQTINDLGWSATFNIENWNTEDDVPYRILHSDSAYFQGIVRKAVDTNKQVLLAALSCNSNKDRGDRENYVRNINHQNPDLIFFAGDQSYDHKEHTAAWLKFGMQFRELFRNRPCITIPDDHDIGQGNLWGEYGKKASSSAGNDGGYFYHPEYVKMVERCQTAHLPDPYDPTPIKQNIGVYYTSLIIGGVDFAILEDRKFKSGPNGKIPQQGPRPDHIKNPNYDPESINLEGLELLGNRQLNFLEKWGNQRTKTHMKAVLSQTGFCGGAHLHGSKENRLHADLDSNGWPQRGRNLALRAIRKANAVHIGGDQHISTVIQHGIDMFEDGPWAFIVPAIVNNYYSRWWWPLDEKLGAYSNSKLPWTGRYLDGFNNKITMHAYANPDTPSNGAGYGLIYFDPKSKNVTFECWPRYSDVTKAEAKQFTGWPIQINLNPI